MTDIAGAVARQQGLITDDVTVKASEDIERGEGIYNDTSGWLAAPNTVYLEKIAVAMEAHDYSEVSEHKIGAAFQGCIWVQKIAGTAWIKGQKVNIGGTAGEFTIATAGDAPAGGASKYYTTTVETGVQLALDTNLRIAGTVAKAAESADTVGLIWLGVH